MAVRVRMTRVGVLMCHASKISGEESYPTTTLPVRFASDFFTSFRRTIS